MNKKTMKIAGWALGLSLAVAGIGAAAGTSLVAARESTPVAASQASPTYFHVMTAKPATGDNTLSHVVWTVSGTNLNNFNNDYQGVQFGTSKANGSITFTSKTAWGEDSHLVDGTDAAYGKAKIKKVYVWLNAGSGTPTASVTIGGKAATSDGTVVTKTYPASSYTETSCITFTPGDADSGVLSITASTSSKAGYFCAIGVDCEEKQSGVPAVNITSNVGYIKLTGGSATITAEIANPTGSEGNIVFASTNEAVATINPSTGAVTAVGVGETTISVTATGAESTSLTFRVLSEHDGLTAETALTGTEAKNIYNYAGDTTTTYFVGGYVSTVNANYYLIDGGAFEFYHATAGDGINLSDIVVGTYIRGSGKLTAYNNQVEFSGAAITYIHNPVLDHLVVSGTLTKTSYYSTASWDHAGLTVTAYYDDDSYEEVTSSSVFSYDIATPGAVDLGGEASKEITLRVTATYEEITGYSDQTVTVNADNLTSLVANNLQNEFAVGDAFSFGAGTLKANHSSNTKTDLTVSDVAVTLGGASINVATYRFVAADNGKTIELSYTEKGITKTTSYAITVSNIFTAGKTMASYEWENQEVVTEFDLDHSVSASITYEGSNSPKYYTNGTSLRIYQNGSTGNTIFTIGVPEYGYSLVSATFVFTVDNTGTLLDASDTSKALTSGEAYALSGKTAQFTVGNSGNATNGQVKISSITVKYQYDAFGNWCDSFLNDLTCDASGATAPDNDQWGTLSTSFSGLGNAVATYAKTLSKDANGNTPERAMARYDYIIGKYNTKTVTVYTDFIDRVAGGQIVLKNASNIGAFVNNQNNIILAVSVLSVGAAAAAGMIIMRKRKEN